MRSGSGTNLSIAPPRCVCFETLRTTYPVSTLTRQSQTHVKRLSDAPVPDIAVTRTPAPAPGWPAPAAATAGGLARRTPSRPGRRRWRSRTLRR